MSLCKSCNALLDLHSWRKYIMTNHQCNFCDMPMFASEIEIRLENDKRYVHFENLEEMDKYLEKGEN